MFGVTETEFLQRRGELVEFVDETSWGKEFLVCGHRSGRFRTWTLKELTGLAADEKADDMPEIEVVYADISEFQGRFQGAERPPMVQVASNFNCCENGNAFGCFLDRGSFVTAHR